MKPWFVQPFPVPYPAPSFTGFFTTTAILIIVLMVLGLPIPLLRVFLDPMFFAREHLWKWSLLFLAIVCIGLITLYQWGTFNELPIGFVWGGLYISGMAMFRVSLQPLAIKHSNNGGDEETTIEEKADH